MSITIVLHAILAVSWSSQTPPGGVLELAEGITLSVVQADSAWSTGTTDGSYVVQGVVLTFRTGISDTLFWIAGLPDRAVPALEAAGLSEERRVELLASGSSWVSGRINIRLVGADGSESRFSAFRTWLLDGTELDLDMVVQRDSLFDSMVREGIGMPSEGNIDSWLWRRGFWFDPQSFVLTLEADSLPLLVLGMPSSEGSDTLLTIELPIQALHTASGSMLD